MSNITWYDGLTLGVEGKGWNNTPLLCQRLPEHLKSKVDPLLWERSLTPAGMCIRFESDSSTLHAKWCFSRESVPPAIETLLRVRGLDLYVKHNNSWAWVGAANPSLGVECQAQIIRCINPGIHEYLLYLPMQDSIDKLEIGCDESSSFKLLPPRTSKPIVYYGTSIAHGGACSRPGLAHVAIIGRRFDIPIINLGMPGMGKMDTPLAEALGELDASLFVIDCLPNMSPTMVEERMVNFYKILRDLKPSTPILFVEEADNPRNILCQIDLDETINKRNSFRKMYSEMQKIGDKKLFAAQGESLFGSDSEATLDGQHPNDLGFLRMANVLTPIIAQILNTKT